jgi:tRNA(Arg) A34 adenosine deaminase TadA
MDKKTATSNIAFALPDKQRLVNALLTVTLRACYLCAPEIVGYRIRRCASELLTSTRTMKYGTAQ